MKLSVRSGVLSPIADRNFICRMVNKIVYTDRIIGKTETTSAKLVHSILLVQHMNKPANRMFLANTLSDLFLTASTADRDVGHQSPLTSSD